MATDPAEQARADQYLRDQDTTRQRQKDLDRKLGGSYQAHTDLLDSWRPVIDSLADPHRVEGWL